MDADEATQAAYEAQIAEWDAVTLDNVPVYNLDIQAAIQLLEQDGWVLNRSGEPYRMSVDDVRCKEIDGQLVPLDLKLLVPEGSVLAGSMDFFFGAHLAVAGIRLTVEQRPMEEILKVYYREEERDCDMIALASNFDVVFEPSVYFQPDPEGQINHHNTTGIATDELYTLLTDLCGTASDDLLGYCRKWVAFQERFQQLEPMIPLYSNVYFDFYTRALHEYDISSNVAWSKAVVGAYMSDPQDEVEEEEEEETEDIIIEDATGMALSGDADEIEIIDG